MLSQQDRKQLEQAAQAFGIQLNGASIAPIYMGEDGQWVRWNPLEDDGDALRLAVKLRLEVYIHERDTQVADGNLISRPVEQHGNDASAATRRAIVRAAAEIGKAM